MTFSWVSPRQVSRDLIVPVPVGLFPAYLGGKYHVIVVMRKNLIKCSHRLGIHAYYYYRSVSRCTVTLVAAVRWPHTRNPLPSRQTSLPSLIVRLRMNSCCDRNRCTTTRAPSEAIARTSPEQGAKGKTVLHSLTRSRVLLSPPPATKTKYLSFSPSYSLAPVLV